MITRLIARKSTAGSNTVVLFELGMNSTISFLIQLSRTFPSFPFLKVATISGDECTATYLDGKREVKHVRILPQSRKAVQTLAQPSLQMGCYCHQ